MRFNQFRYLSNLSATSSDEETGIGILEEHDAGIFRPGVELELECETLRGRQFGDDNIDTLAHDAVDHHQWTDSADVAADACRGACIDIDLGRARLGHGKAGGELRYERRNTGGGK